MADAARAGQHHRQHPVLAHHVAAEPTGYAILSHQTTFTGRCPACQAAASSPAP